MGKRRRKPLSDVLDKAAAMDTLADFETYLRYELGRSALTVKAYMRDVREYAGFITGGDTSSFRPDDITTSDIRVWLADMGRKGLALTSVKRKLQSIRAYFHFLHRRGLISANPAAPIEMRIKGRTLPTYVSQSDMQRLLESDATAPDADTFEGLRDRLIITLLYTTGMRRAEISGLCDSDISYGRCEIRVTGKGNKQRIIPIAGEVAADIRRYQTLRDATFPNLEKSHRLFIHKGKNLSESKLSQIVATQLAGTGAERRTPHVLRHTFATVMLNNGADINSVKAILGHASLKTTQIYTHVTFADMKRDYINAHPRAKKGGNEKKD